MFSAFPSDMDPRHFDNDRRPLNNGTPIRYPEVPPGSVTDFRRRTAQGHFHYTGETLRYPAALPTSGLPATIVEFSRPVLLDFSAPVMPSRLVGYTEPSPAAQASSRLVEYTQPSPSVPLTVPGPAPSLPSAERPSSPPSSTVARKKKKKAPRKCLPPT